MKDNHELSILVLSCDKYQGVWDDFFYLKDKYWPDCPFKTYLATDRAVYNRENVSVIHFGDIKTWTVCVRKALAQINTTYVAIFLEDAFIYKTIDTSIIFENLKIMDKHSIDFLTLERNRMCEYVNEKDQIEPHIWKIYKHQKYGIDTSAAIWKKEFLAKLLKKADLNAWMFEVSQNKAAASRDGLEGRIYFDDRQPFNISPVEIVREGKITPDSIRFFRKRGYNINRDALPVMSEWKLLWYKLKAFVVTHKFVYTIARPLARFVGIRTYNNR